MNAMQYLWVLRNADIIVFMVGAVAALICVAAIELYRRAKRCSRHTF